MRTLLASLLCLCLLIIPAVADDAAEVRTLLMEKIDAVVALLQDRSLAKPLRNERILAIVAPLFDYQAMARLSLGKKHWPTLNPAQQTTFITLFTTRLQQSYLDKLDLYSDEEVQYGEPRREGKTVHMPSTLIARDSRIDMLYKFYRTTRGWLIYDVEIGGVSVIQTYRSQFDGVLSEGSLDDLLEKLKTDGDFAIPAPGEEGAPPGQK